MKIAGLAPEFFNGETVGINSQLVLYEKDIVEVLGKQLVLASNEYVRFRRGANRLGAAWHPVNSK